MKNKYFPGIQSLASYVTVVSVFLLASCSGFFGSKTDISFIEVPDYSVKAVAYVPIQPVITGFSEPSDIVTGFDHLMYVVDKGSSEIIAFDESMVRLGSMTVPGVTSMVQDRRLDILALGTIDTLINTTKFKLACIYRIKITNETYGIQTGKVIEKIIHPFYMTSTVKTADTNTRFTGVAVLAENSYYISRTGNTQNNLIGGPDENILYFTNDDVFSFSLVSDYSSSDNLYKKPAGIASFVQPPQSSAITDNRDFLVISNNPTESLKAKYISYSVSDGAPQFTLNQNLVVGDTSKATGFLYTQGKFTTPSDVSVSGDGTQLIFISDAEKDSVYIFTNTGLEGVNPPAGSSSKKNIKVSFGGSGLGLSQFNTPSAVAYNSKILYVADAGNKRILRFKLTTDFK